MRLVQAVLALVALGAVNLYTSSSIGNWWLWVGIGTLVSVALFEPYFTDTRTAVGNAVAAVGATVGATRAGVDALWDVYLVMAVVAGLSAAIALTFGPGRLQVAARWIATRFGRAQVLGFSALFIEVVRISNTSLRNGVALLLGLAFAMAVSSLDWYRLLIGLPGLSSAIATVEVATEPNLLLVATDRILPIGKRVRIHSEGHVDGTVVAQMAHKNGSRFQVVLDQSWRTAIRHGRSECTVEVLEESDPSIGFAAERSTERLIEIHPLRDLMYGEALIIKNQDDERLLYQVAGLRLSLNDWDNSSVIEPRARALQVGCIAADGIVSFRPYLPKPYQTLASGGDLSVSLPDGYERIGVIAGTGIEVGLNIQVAGESHLAILGMSGMGKTTVARRICGLRSQAAAVVAVDETGEYRSRQGFSSFKLDQIPLDEAGESVYEPAGDPPVVFKDFLKKVMDKSHAEYAEGGEPFKRTILVEEAHAFLPETNFSTFPQRDAVAISCRYILQARKFGLSFIFVSQRTAVISKSALSQCESYVIFRTLDQTSLEYIEGVVGADYREAVASLRRHQAICVGPAFNTTSPVIVDIDPPVAEQTDDTTS